VEYGNLRKFFGTEDEIDITRPVLLWHRAGSQRQLGFLVSLPQCSVWCVCKSVRVTCVSLWQCPTCLPCHWLLLFCQ